MPKKYMFSVHVYVVLHLVIREKSCVGKRSKYTFKDHPILYEN